MWKAHVLAGGGDPTTVPWERMKHLYDTIDVIDDINMQWTTFNIKYQVPCPQGTPLAWMTKTYRVLARDCWISCV